MIKVDIEKAFDHFELKTKFESDAGITAICGRSGSGKSTVANAIAGLLRSDRGMIDINGVRLYDSEKGLDVPVGQRRIGYVFQDGRLFPHLTVKANLCYGYSLTPRSERYVEPELVIDVLGLGHLLTRRPGYLSGGEKQRVAIGRALLASPRLLLMDEPLASLDNQRKREILQYIDRLHREVRVPIVYVTHAVDEIVTLADVVVVLSQGRVVAAGELAQIMVRPELQGVTGGFEESAAIDVSVVSHDLQYGITTLSFAGGELYVPTIAADVSERLRLRVRARDVTLALQRPVDVSVLNVLQGRVSAINASSGPTLDVEVDVNGVVLIARITRLSAERLRLAPGDPVYALLKAIAFEHERNEANQELTISR